MALAATITSKGQVTIPKKIRDLLGSRNIEFSVEAGNVTIRPARNVGAALNKYAGKYRDIDEVRNKAWSEVAREKTRNS